MITRVKITKRADVDEVAVYCADKCIGTLKAPRDSGETIALRLVPRATVSATWSWGLSVTEFVSSEVAA